MRPRSHLRLPIAAILVIASGCDEGVDVSGLEPAAAAAAVTDELCGWLSSCGDVEIECTGSGEGARTCTAMVVEVDFEDCQREQLPDVLEDFNCSGTLEGAEAELVNACINGLTATPCVSQSEIEDYAEMLETGDPPPLRDAPAECAVLDQVFDDCSGGARGPRR